MKYTGKTESFFETVDITQANHQVVKKIASSELAFLWFQSENNQLRIDGIIRSFDINDMLCLTEFNKVEIVHIGEAKLLKWNKHFYCVINHDSEVGCKGILFYGSSQLPIVRLPKQELERFSLVWRMLEMEMYANDNLQEEMLQMMLKRILILSTRLYREQSDLNKVKTEYVEIIRAYHFLVEQHFKEKHTVAEYAKMLHKSPKTLSNLFKKLGSKSPLQFIKDRKMLEARRLLAHTDKTVSEIGYDLGFAEVQSFSRFFKREAGLSPNEFQKKMG